MNLQITLPLPMDAGLNPNGAHGNFRAVAAARKKARELARLACVVETRRLNWGGNLEACPAGYSLYIMYSFKRNTDLDNITARCKSYIDGVAEFAGINDRDINLLITQKQKANKGESGVYISLTNFDLNDIKTDDKNRLL